MLWLLPGRRCGVPGASTHSTRGEITNQLGPEGVKCRQAHPRDRGDNCSSLSAFPTSYQETGPPDQNFRRVCEKNLALLGNHHLLPLGRSSPFDEAKQEARNH